MVRLARWVLQSLGSFVRLAGDLTWTDSIFSDQ